MKRKLTVNGKEVEVDILSMSNNEICFIFNNEEHYFKLKTAENGKTLLIDRQNKNFTVYASAGLFDCPQGQFKIKNAPGVSNIQENEGSGSLISPLPGKVVKILAQAGQKVKAGDEILHIEAMKMEHRICAAVNGLLKNIAVKEGDAVSDGQLLGEIE